MSHYSGAQEPQEEESAFSDRVVSPPMMLRDQTFRFVIQLEDSDTGAC